MKLIYIISFQIIAVCDFLNYLKYIERGLVKSSGKFNFLLVYINNNYLSMYYARQILISVLFQYMKFIGRLYDSERIWF